MLKNIFRSIFKYAANVSSGDIDTSRKEIIISEKQAKIWHEHSPICPHCSVPFEEWPERKKKCKNCKQEVYVEKHPSSVKWSIVDKSTSENWRKERTKKNFIKRWLKILEQYGISETDFENILKQGKHSYRDIIWGLFNQALAASVGNFQTSGLLYLHMAIYVSEEGKDPTYLIELCREMELQKIDFQVRQSRTLTGDVEILTKSVHPSSCSNCHFLHGKILSIEQARRTKPLPHKNCELQYCRGMYLSVSCKTK